MAQGGEGGHPHIIVVNHLDRERTDFGAVVDELRERFGQAVVPLNLPIGSENDLKGIYGLLTGTSFVDGEQREEIPEGMEDEVDTAKTQLFEAIAESDDTLLEKYLEGEEITTEEAFEGIRKGIAEGLIIPVLAASAERMIGIDRLLDVIAGSAPSPSDLERWAPTTSPASSPYFITKRAKKSRSWGPPQPCSRLTWTRTQAA